jgi:hypothetical protein
MPIQETPPPGWPHTEAAKYYDQESKRILKKAAPPEQQKEGRGCGGAIVTIIILAVVAVIVAAVVIGLVAESEGDDLESAANAYLAEYPSWTVETEDYPDSTGAVRLVTWENDLGIGRVVRMEPDPLAEGEWTEQPLLPAGTEWSQDLFYDAFSDAYSGVQWTYAVVVEPSVESTSAESFDITYTVWDVETEQWTEMFVVPATLDPSSGWVIGAEESATTTTTE